MNINQSTMKEVYDKFGLEASTRDFIGHSMALFTTDDYINQKGAARDAIERIRLYVNSMARYGKSPYIYPLYGLGELPQGFARLSAIYGGTYMLNTDVDEVLYENGKAVGIKATMKERDQEGEGMTFTTKCSKILADPSYFPQKVKPVGHLLKAICILNHPIEKTDNSDSVQLIIPQSQIGRKHGKLKTRYVRVSRTDQSQTSTSPWCHGHTTWRPRATTLLSFRPSPRATATTTSSCRLDLTALARSRRSSWDRQSPSTSPLRAERRTTFSSREATTQPATLRLPQVRCTVKQGASAVLIVGYRRHQRYLQKSRGSRAGGRGTARGPEPGGRGVDECLIANLIITAGMPWLFFFVTHVDELRTVGGLTCDEKAEEEEERGSVKAAVVGSRQSGVNNHVDFVYTRHKHQQPRHDRDTARRRATNDDKMRVIEVIIDGFKSYAVRTVISGWCVASNPQQTEIQTTD